MKKGKNIVRKIIQSGMDTFKELFGKLDDSDCKRLYNRCYRRLDARKLSKEKIKSFIVDEIRGELFKLLPKIETKITTDAEIQEREDLKSTKDFPVRMHGVKLWSKNDVMEDAKKDLENLFNDHVQKVMRENICGVCRSSVCMCQDY